MTAGGAAPAATMIAATRAPGMRQRPWGAPPHRHRAVTALSGSQPGGSAASSSNTASPVAATLKVCLLLAGQRRLAARWQQPPQRRRGRRPRRAASVAAAPARESEAGAGVEGQGRLHVGFLDEYLLSWVRPRLDAAAQAQDSTLEIYDEVLDKMSPEEAVLDGQVDVAVVDLRELRLSDLPEELTIAAVLPREDAREAILLRAGAAAVGSLGELPAGAVVSATSELCRLQVLALVSGARVRGSALVDLSCIRDTVETHLR